MQSRAFRTVAFLVNGDKRSPAAYRARAFTAVLKDCEAHIEYRDGNRFQAIRKFVFFLRARRPAVTYVMDMCYSGVAAGLIHRVFFRNRLIIDTGDSIWALARSTGTRGRFGIWLTWLLEEFSLRLADCIVVRGTMHAWQLSRRGVRATVIQDGVESDLFRPMDVRELRRQYKLDGAITIGVLGSVTWSPKLEMCYGSELVEVVHLLRDLPVVGVVIGDGSGMEILKKRVRRYGLEDKILFLGRIPYEDLPRHVNLIDVCLSTQTNDEVGQARTTGKLPLYLACGRYVLATRVGEAALVLSEEMLVDYEGVADPIYPERLAQKIRSILDNPAFSGEKSRYIATQHFEYSVLATKLSAVLRSV